MDPKLYEAATLGDVSYLRRIRDGDVLLNHDFLLQKTPKDNNILHIAAEFKQIDFFRQVPNRYSPALFWAANKKGDTPLHVAARVGCAEIVEFLIGQAKALHFRGADMESGHGKSHRKVLLRMTNLEMDTALHVAVRYGHHGVVVMLMEADPELCCLTNSAHESALFLAVRKGSVETALHLLKMSPVCPSFQGTNGVTALHAAVTRTNLTCVVSTMVFKNREMIKNVDALGWTPLHYAAFRGNLEATKVLMQYDSSASYILDKSGMSALHVAAYAGHTKLMEELILGRPDICDLVDDKGRTALHAAVLGAQVKVVEYILKKLEFAAIINEADKDGNTPLHLAAIQQNAKIIKVLSSDSKVDMIAINKDFLKPIDMFLGDNIGAQETTRSTTVLHNLGCSIGVPFFQQQINRDFDKLESPEKDTDNRIRDNQPQDPPVDNNGSKRDDTKLLVATIIATVTFAASFTNVPGGFKDDGMPVLYHQATFKVFQFFNAVSFYISILAIYNESTPITVLSMHLPTPSSLIQYSIGGMVVAFFSGTLAVQPRQYEGGHLLKFLVGTNVVDIVLAVICGILLILAIKPVVKSLVQIIRRNHWVGNRVI